MSSVLGGHGKSMQERRSKRQFTCSSVVRAGMQAAASHEPGFEVPGSSSRDIVIHACGFLMF
eukprot:606718-Hanusia_phi.AAC.1